MDRFFFDEKHNYVVSVTGRTNNFEITVWNANKLVKKKDGKVVPPHPTEFGYDERIVRYYNKNETEIQAFLTEYEFQEYDPELLYARDAEAEAWMDIGGEG